MKTFQKFIFETYLILEKRGEPTYNYEVALERLYNHLIKGDNKANVTGKRMRLAVSKGDMNTVTDIIAQELDKAEKDPKHPLHFSNASDEGFTGGKKTDDHRNSYYQNLRDQAFTVLNDVQSRSGRSLGSRGFVAKREGESKVELTPAAQRLYDKLQDTSKPDITFSHPTRPEQQSKTSLKKASGAVSASSGAEETYGNLGIAIDSAIKKGLKSGDISKDQVPGLQFSAMSLAGKIREIMRGSKGKDKEQQAKELRPEVEKNLGDLEKIIPGVTKETGIEQLTGKGKYGSGGVDRMLTTGRGGGTVEDPRAISVSQRARAGKGTTKTKEGPVQRPMAVTGDIEKSPTGTPSSFGFFSRRAQAAAQKQHAQTAADLEQQTAAAETDLQAAQKAAADAMIVRGSNGKPVPRKNAFFLQNNPAEAERHNQNLAAANDAVTSAQSNLDAAVTAHQTHINTPPTPVKSVPQKVQQQAPQPSPEPSVPQPVQQVEPSIPQPSQPVEAPKPQEDPNKKKPTAAGRMDAAGRRLGLR